MSTLIQKSECLIEALEKRDSYTKNHCGRVESLCLQMAQCSHLDAHETMLLKLASRLHDVGKIGIPDHILLKPGRLDDDDLKIMRTHAELGENICDKLPHQNALSISHFVRHHHEAFDGSGYPDGLSEDEIPLCSRIISLADSYDAMLTTRPYQKARSHEQVIEIMQSECGRKSDPLLFAQFEQIVSHSASIH